MTTKYTVTTLRKQLYKVVDEVLQTGVPVEIERHGQTLLLVPAAPSAKLTRLKRRDVIVGDPDELVSLNVAEWHPDPR